MSGQEGKYVLDDLIHKMKGKVWNISSYTENTELNNIPYFIDNVNFFKKKKDCWIVKARK